MRLKRLRRTSVGLVLERDDPSACLRLLRELGGRRGKGGRFAYSADTVLVERGVPRRLFHPDVEYPSALVDLKKYYRLHVAIGRHTRRNPQVPAYPLMDFIR